MKKSAIINSIKIGRHERVSGIIADVRFRIEDGGFASNVISLERIEEIMEQEKCYNDVQELVGKPCFVDTEGWGTPVTFIGMWGK